MRNVNKELPKNTTMYAFTVKHNKYMKLNENLSTKP